VGLLEVVVDVDSLFAGFVYLRANLVIGVSAALALLGTLLLIRLRFPHYLRGKQLEIQVEMARRVQADLLPTSQPRSREADIASICQPAWHAGGDFYDAFDTDGDRLALILGDVSGKGIAAAPLMGFIHGAAHASAWTESGYDHETASRRLNDLLFRKTALDRFVSMFWGYFDRDASMLRYINAGHLPALLLRGGPLGVETTRLTEGGPVLGVVPGASYTQGTVQVEPGDVLLVFSDGIAEALNAADDEFGEKRIIDAAVHAWRGSAEDIRDRVVSEVRAFTRGREANDDRTLVVMRFEHAPAAGCEEAPDAVYA
jgi:sigma-B regulation protein RsbU (phosphoserine phosphatase)